MLARFKYVPGTSVTRSEARNVGFGTTTDDNLVDAGKGVTALGLARLAVR
jgi:hypothetical protein